MLVTVGLNKMCKFLDFLRLIFFIMAYLKNGNEFTKKKMFNELPEKTLFHMVTLMEASLENLWRSFSYKFTSISNVSVFLK
mmetsp:Transcript_6110/g.9110  ORF Transcript_6110/g.9110 Transcript_6110/m.9110 type:complete len:81 (-) Transcript_6110:23-265(-)